MPMKGRGTSGLREIDRWDHGVGWLAYPDRMIQRADHAAKTDGDVWLFDPVDAPGVGGLLAEFGDVAGVVVGLDRHKRNLAALANCHEVPIYVVSWMISVAGELDATVERFGAGLADSGSEAFRLVDRSVPPWQEAGFYHDGCDLLIIPESVGTVGYFYARGEYFGVRSMFRPFPPRRMLFRYDPDRLLVGHGVDVPVDADDELRTALGNARRNLPSAYARAFASMLSD